MSRMTGVGDRVQCPKSRGAAHVVWVSRDGKAVAVKCMKYHSQINPPPTACAPKEYPSQDGEGNRVFSGDEEGTSMMLQ